MKVVYIAHPIGGDVRGNLEKIRLIVREVNLTMPDIVPFVPYFVDCMALDDSVNDNRDRGMQNTHELFMRGFIDEVWLMGPHISKGMKWEKLLAELLNVTVIDKTG